MIAPPGKRLSGKGALTELRRCRQSFGFTAKSRHGPFRIETQNLACADVADRICPARQIFETPFNRGDVARLNRQLMGNGRDIDIDLIPGVRDSPNRHRLSCISSED